MADYPSGAEAKECQSTNDVVSEKTAAAVSGASRGQPSSANTMNRYPLPAEAAATGSSNTGSVGPPSAAEMNEAQVSTSTTGVSAAAGKPQPHPHRTRQLTGSAPTRAPVKEYSPSRSVKSNSSSGGSARKAGSARKLGREPVHRPLSKDQQQLQLQHQEQQGVATVNSGSIPALSSRPPRWTEAEVS